MEIGIVMTDVVLLVVHRNLYEMLTQGVGDYIHGNMVFKNSPLKSYIARV